jgi:hypothetical protein
MSSGIDCINVNFTSHLLVKAAFYFTTFLQKKVTLGEKLKSDFHDETFVSLNKSVIHCCRFKLSRPENAENSRAKKFRMSLNR